MMRRLNLGLESAYTKTQSPGSWPGGCCSRRPSHSISPGVDRRGLSGPRGSPAPPAYLLSETHDAGQEADEDVRVDAPLVGLVDDHHLVLQQQEVLGRRSRDEDGHLGRSTPGRVRTPKHPFNEPLW